QVKKIFQVCLGVTDYGVSLITQFGVELAGDRSVGSCLKCRYEQEPLSLEIVFGAYPRLLDAVGVKKPGDPGHDRSKLMPEVQIRPAVPAGEVNGKSDLGFQLISFLDRRGVCRLL